MLLSIIIPVYKVENYIEKCLQSIVEGYTLRDKGVEVIVVEDGSPDQSGVIAESFAEKSSFFRVIHKENAGVAAARNTGMRAASGKWLYFADSDDWLADGAVDTICKRLEENADADILMFDAYQNMPDEERSWEHFEQNRIWDGSEDIRLLQRGMLYFPLVDKRMKTPLAAPWDKVYRSAFLKEKGISFREQLKVLDDMVFNMEAFGAAQKVVYCKDRIYHYRYVPDSITNQYKANRVEQDCAVWEFLRNYIDNNCRQDKERFWQAYYCRIVKSFSICTRLQFFNDKNPSCFSEKLKEVKHVLACEPYYEAFHKVKLRNAEWKLKIMICMGRLQWGYGIFLLYMGQRIL